MIIETQNTPDENVMNFFPSQKILIDKRAEFIDSKSLRSSPLAQNIFDLGGIVSLFFTSDMISVTKEKEAQWTTLKPQILAEIMDYLSSGQDVVTKRQTQQSTEEIKQAIISLLNARIRPALQKDGGDIKFCAFEEGTVYVELQGNCSGCPYAARTLKEGVEKILQTYISEVKAVKNISEKND